MRLPAITRTLSTLLAFVLMTVGSWAQAESQEIKDLRAKAEKGDAVAQFNLGGFYENGEGVPKDSAEAAKWYRKAAEQGDAVAQFKLGYAYANGEGVPKDFAEAAKWYRKAAEKGAAYAQSCLGFMYTKGEGVPKNNVEAYAWLLLATSKGNQEARENFGILEKQMTPAAILEGQKRTKELMKELEEKKKKKGAK